jgi:hypothetical protein
MTYRISLRSSSLWDPRHPLLKVFRLIIFVIIRTRKKISLDPTSKCIFYHTLWLTSILSLDDEREKNNCSITLWITDKTVECYSTFAGIGNTKRQIIKLLTKKLPYINIQLLGFVGRKRNRLFIINKFIMHKWSLLFWWVVLGVVMILPQVHLRKPCYDFTFL